MTAGVEQVDRPERRFDPFRQPNVGNRIGRFPASDVQSQTPIQVGHAFGCNLHVFREQFGVRQIRPRQRCGDRVRPGIPVGICGDAGIVPGERPEAIR